MQLGQLNISATDLLRLRDLLDALSSRGQGLRPDLRALQCRLDQAIVNAHKEVPEDVVTVDSEVRLSDGRTGAEIRCSIVFPECAEAAVGRISVLAPLGAALLGHRTGERVAFDAPEGPRNCEILSVQQRPESSSG